MNEIGKMLKSNFWVKIVEILIVFASAFLIIKIFTPFAKDNLVHKQAVIWIANILMLLIVWIGLKLRGENFSHFGLTFKKLNFKQILNGFFLSLLVLLLAVIGFVLGSIIMANITGIPESSDMSNYTYLQDNLVMLILTLMGVYIVSSFGEEIIYRGFLINRLNKLGISQKYKTAIPVILSSMIFGLVHYEWGPMGVVQTGFMGLAFGIMYIKLKKKIWILIVAHAYMDTILMLQLYFAKG